MIEDGFRHAHELIQQDVVLRLQLVIPLLHRLKLLLHCDQLPIHHIHLLCGNDDFVWSLIRFSRRWRFSSDIVERIFVIRFEIWMLKFPSLSFD